MSPRRPYRPGPPGSPRPGRPAAGPIKPPLPRILPPSKGMPYFGIEPQVSNLLAGPSQMAAQRKLNQRSERKELWPYTHTFPPPQAIRVEPEGIIPAPLPGVTSVVLQYQVPDGFQFVLTGLIAIYSGTNYFLGSTDITWLLDINTPLPTPQGGTPQGYPVQQMSPSNIPKGGISPAPGSVFAPWPLPMPEVLGPLDTLRSKVTTTAAIPVGAPNAFITIFLGWMWESTL